MKKILLSLAAVLVALSSQAQIVGNDYDSPIVSENGTSEGYDPMNAMGLDVFANYNSDSKFASFAWGKDLSEYLYTKTSFGLCVDKLFDSYAYVWGLGAKRRCVFNDSFLVQAMIYPYIGYGGYKEYSYNYNTGKESSELKGEFAYGASVNISAGLKLWETDKGNTTFITLGYYMDAYKFKTDNMVKNGAWGIGFTTILK